MKTFAEEVWSTLSTVNVSAQAETKGRFTYLSWAWAWQILNDHYPDNSKSICEKTWSDGSMEVGCEIELRSKEGEVLTRCETLPVMDHNNRAIKNPDATAINKARKRCEAKCIALFGLGLHVYQGEDLPAVEDGRKKEWDRVNGKLSRLQAEYFGDEVWDFVSKDLVRSPEIQDRIAALETLENVVELREQKERQNGQYK